MKQKTYKEKETLHERGTKRYQERLVEEQEAEKEIKEFVLNEENDGLQVENDITGIPGRIL